MARRSWALATVCASGASLVTVASPWLGATGSEELFHGYIAAGRPFRRFDTVAFSLAWLPFPLVVLVGSLSVVQFGSSLRAAGGGRSVLDWIALGASFVAVGVVMLVAGASGSQGFAPTRTVLVAAVLTGITALCAYRIAEPVADEIPSAARASGRPNSFMAGVLGVCGASVGFAACAPWASIASTEELIRTFYNGTANGVSTYDGKALPGFWFPEIAIFAALCSALITGVAGALASRAVRSVWAVIPAVVATGGAIAITVGAFDSLLQEGLYVRESGARLVTAALVGAGIVSLAIAVVGGRRERTIRSNAPAPAGME